MVPREEFDAARVEMCGSGPASDSDNLLGMEMDFCAFLGDPAFANEDPGLWHGMKVTRHEGSEWLIMGRAHGRTADTIKIENALAEIWESRLRYEYREAHTSNASGEAVHFQAVTQTAPGGMWVTVDVWVTLH